jgi:hypothetical protein
MRPTASDTESFGGMLAHVGMIETVSGLNTDYAVAQCSLRALVIEIRILRMGRRHTCQGQ